MRIYIPWKPVVLVWGLLSGMIFVGFVASSALQGKDPFAPGASITQPAAAKRDRRNRGNNLGTPTRRLRLQISRAPETYGCRFACFRHGRCEPHLPHTP